MGLSTYSLSSFPLELSAELSAAIMLQSSIALFAVSSCLLTLLTTATNVKECRSFWNNRVGMPPLNISLHGCNSYPCSLLRGSNITGGMDFMYDKDLSVLTPEITVYWLGLPFGWPINQNNGCDSLTINSCPIKANTRARYEYSLFLKKWVPLVSPYIWFKFKDENGDIVICCEVPIKIVDNGLEQDES